MGMNVLVRTVSLLTRSICTHHSFAGVRVRLHVQRTTGGEVVNTSTSTNQHEKYWEARLRTGCELQTVVVVVWGLHHWESSKANSRKTHKTGMYIKYENAMKVGMNVADNNIHTPEGGKNIPTCQ